MNLLGTWSINNQSKSTITFDNFIKYAHWKYSQYCCDVNIQKFVVNLGHKIFEGYWNATLYINSPMYYIHSPKYLLPMFPSSIGLCTFNIQDRGEYHENISNIWSSPLSGCTNMTVDVIDSNHLNLHSPSSVMYQTRESG
ncbi:MAG: hypothetical protein WA364_10505 [Candidatus Nitrosopolaris sp.]